MKKSTKFSLPKSASVPCAWCSRCAPNTARSGRQSRPLPQDRLHDTEAVQLDASHKRDTGQRDGVSTAEARRIKELEREVRELKRVNEILRLAGAFLAQAELDRHRKS